MSILVLSSIGATLAIASKHAIAGTLILPLFHPTCRSLHLHTVTTCCTVMVVQLTTSSARNTGGRKGQEVSYICMQGSLLGSHSLWALSYA